MRKIGLISSVSGGSIAAGLLASVWQKLTWDSFDRATNLEQIFVARALEFSQVFIDLPCILKGILNPFSTASLEAAKALEDRLFLGAGGAITELVAKPWFVFCSSNLTTGSLFRMSNRYIADYRIGIAYGAPLPLSVAVAASAAFPPFLSPLRLDLTKFEWTLDKLDGTVGDPLSPGRAILTDGGVYDNHGIEPALKRCDTLFVSDAGAPWHGSRSGFRTYISQLKRVLDTTDNQVRSLRRRDLISRFNAAKEAEALSLAPESRRALEICLKSSNAEAHDCGDVALPLNVE
ncbi:hypothetical protein A6U85_25410 [Agrobacterium sp. 13-626]|nr:hypothetical protein A6U85_25410 [Agrobacterium sp. 13-626]